MGSQLRRLVQFDSLFEAGHSVAYFLVDRLTPVTPARLEKFQSMKLFQKQVPWQRDLFIVVEDRVILYNTSTGSVVDEILDLEPSKIFFDIQGTTILLLQNYNELIDIYFE